MSQDPLVSVVIPVFNGDRFLAAAVESVFRQTYPQVELVVVDDGSCDRSRDILQSYGDRLRYVWQTNQGVAAARNRGLQDATGEYIAFLDQDDIYHPHKLALQMACLKAQPDVGWVNSGWQIVDEQGQIQSAVEPWHGLPILDLAAWIVWKPVFLGAMLFRRPWLDEMGGFNPQLQQTSDVDLALRLAIAGCQADWVKQPTVRYRQHSGNASRQVHHQIRELEEMLVDLLSQPDLPDLVRSLMDQSRYQSLVWCAWRLYQTGYLDDMVDYLGRSLSHTDQPRTATLSDWIKHFSNYEAEYGREFNGYTLSQTPQWQRLVQNEILQLKV